MGKSRPLFSYFPQFNKLMKAYLDDVLGTRARGGRMEGADESTELLRYPYYYHFVIHQKKK